MFTANVLRMMIASPGDVSDERRIVGEEVNRWNDAHGSTRKLILQLLHWGTHGSAQPGSPPQEIVSRELLDEADILIGIFGARMGSETAPYVSSTVEEIKRHITAGKTARVYFSDIPIHSRILEAVQYEPFQEFKDALRHGGLYATYSRMEDLRDSLRQHLAIDLNQPRYMWIPGPVLMAAKAESPLTSDDMFAVTQAAEVDGRITILSTVSGDLIAAGRRNLTDGSPDSAAHWKDVIEKLCSRGLLEPAGTRGSYRLTGAAYRAIEASGGSRENTQS